MFYASISNSFEVFIRRGQMYNDPYNDEEEQWVIWNDSYGVVDTVSLGKIEMKAARRAAWLNEPYDMVGPFNLDELETIGRIHFAACTIMSRKKWEEDQFELRKASLEKRRKAQRRFFEDMEKANRDRRRPRSHYQKFNEKECRDLLKLPISGELDPSEIKSAFRKLAKKVHPDVGGNHEHFIQITEARDVLLQNFV